MMAAVLIAASAHAQIGIIAGVTTPSTDIKQAYNDIVEAQNVTLYHAGLALRFDLPFGLVFQPGVVYNMKGAALSDQIATKKVDISTSTGYLEIPLQLQLGVRLGESVRPYIFAEPYAGYAITTQSKTEVQDAADQSIIEKAASEQGIKLNTINSDGNKWNGRERLEYGVGAGFGVELFNTIAISAKYYWEMGKMFNEDGQPSLSAKAMYEHTKNTQCNGIVASITLYL